MNKQHEPHKNPTATKHQKKKHIFINIAVRGLASTLAGLLFLEVLIASDW